MTDLQDQLRAAAEAPPPTRIDLDVLIDNEVRRRRTVRWAGVTAAFAGVLAVAVAVPIALGGRAAYPPGDAAAGGPCPTAGAPGPQQSHAKPRPTEQCAEAVARLAVALSVALANAAPNLDAGPVEFAYVPVRLRYDATVTLTGPRSRDELKVELIASHEHPGRTDAGCLTQCDYDRAGDGTIVVATQDEQRRQVSVYRPDGTAVLLLAYATSGARPAVTLDQVVAIARTPGLTLFPQAAPVATVAAPSAAASAAPQDAAAARLSAALGERLAAAMPDATFTDPNTPTGAPAPSFSGSRESGYKAGVDIADAEGISHLYASVLSRRPPCADPPNCEQLPDCPMVDDGTRCEVALDGTVRLLMWIEDGEFRTFQIELHRPDGSIVQLGLNNFAPTGADTTYGTILCGDQGCKSEPTMTVTRTRLPLTLDQLVEIGGALRL
jgi:hypothetical protein